MALNSFRIEGLAALESVLISHGSVTMHSEDFDASCLILLDLLSSCVNLFDARYGLVIVLRSEIS